MGSPGPVQTAVRTGKIQGRQTGHSCQTLSVEGAGGRKKSFSSQLTCSMLCMDTLGIEPRAFCMRSGCTHPSNGHTSFTLRKWGRDDLAHGHTGDWAQGLLHAKRMYTSQQWPHESYTEKMGAGWFRAFFLNKNISVGWKKPFSSQLTCSMLCIEPRAFCMRSGCTHPSNGHTSPTLRKWGRDDLAHGHTGDWAQGLLHAKRMYTSQQWPHESYTEKMGAGWFRAFFEQEHLSRIGVEKTA